MGWNDQVYFEQCNDLQHLLADGTLKEGSAAYCVARLMIKLGPAALSKRDRYVYDTVIAPALDLIANEQIPAHC